MRIEIDRVTRRFAGHAAVDAARLSIQAGEYLVLLGPSGCGKTTMLRLIAGFEAPDEGTIRLGDRLVAGDGAAVPPADRAIGIVFQSYALWPHMTVAENVGFALRVRGVDAGERQRQSGLALAQVGLSGFEGRRPAELSGGQRQRVALARCLAMKPPVVLLDEPLANLDPDLRQAMQRELAAMHRALGSTFVHVTHDQAEAFALADRVAVMESGRIRQCAPPQTLYDEPDSAFVARFVGNGALLSVERLDDVATGRARVRVAGQLATVRARPGPPGPAMLCLRRGDLALVPAGDGGLTARVTDRRYLGGGFALGLTLELPDPVEVAAELRADPPGIGEAVGVAIRDGWLLPYSSD